MCLRDAFTNNIECSNFPADFYSLLKRHKRSSDRIFVQLIICYLLLSNVFPFRLSSAANGIHPALSCSLSIRLQHQRHLILHSAIYVCRAFYCLGEWQNEISGKSCFSRICGGLRREKVKDYGVTSCVARNVNKYNLSEGYRIFWHLWPLFMAFPLNVFLSSRLFFLFSLQPPHHPFTEGLYLTR